MRTGSIALSVAVSIGAMIAQAAQAQEYRGTMEQQMACTPDVWRLCSDQIPDTNRIVACLQQNTPQLSSACRSVFASRNQAQRQEQPPHGRAQPRNNNAPQPQAMPPRPYDDDDND